MITFIEKLNVTSKKLKISISPKIYINKLEENVKKKMSEVTVATKTLSGSKKKPKLKKQQRFKLNT